MFTPEPPARVLFVLKRRDNPYAGESPYCGYSQSLSSGLSNSVKFCVELLNELGIEAKAEEVIDNNGIHGAVVRYGATHCLVEALWVVPEKFAELHKLLPNVKWIVRIHSEVPFLANEGIAMDWITRYFEYPVIMAANSLHAYRDLRNLAKTLHPDWDRSDLEEKVAYLPNYYPDRYDDIRERNPLNPGDTINVGCFGAIRPLKNNLIQAIAAINFADPKGLRLQFHVNSTRLEGGVTADNIIKNLRALFAKSTHSLIEHDWMAHEQFLEVLRRMDVSLCVSMSETFCIVAADSIAMGVPTVVSPEIKWAAPHSVAQTTDSASIEKAIDRALNRWLHRAGKNLNKWGLRRFCSRAARAWAKYFGIIK